VKESSPDKSAESATTQQVSGRTIDAEVKDKQKA